MPNVLHAVLKTELLQDHPLGESLSLFYERLPTWDVGLERISGYSVDDLLQRALRFPTVEWLVVHGEGTLYRSQNKVIGDVEDFIRRMEPNVLVVGHLIDKPGFYCGVHEQFLIININAYRDLQFPSFGVASRRELTLQNYSVVSNGGKNDEPGAFESRQGQSLYQIGASGWHFLHIGFQSGYRALNLPESLCSVKTYLHPYEQTTKLLQNIEAMYNIMPMDNFEQNKALVYLLLKKLGMADWPGGVAAYPKRKESVFALNTELLIPDAHWIRAHGGELACFIGTCAGFLDAANLKHFGFSDKTKLIYYDLNPDSITFKKHLLNHFDGELENLPQFIEEFKLKHPDVIIADNNLATGLSYLRREFATSEDFKSVWNRMQRLERKFTQSNLFTDYKAIVGLAGGPQQKTLMCISDIYTGMNELTYGVHVLRRMFRQMVSDLKDYEQLILQGMDYKHSPVLDYLPDLDRKYGEAIFR